MTADRDQYVKAGNANAHALAAVAAAKKRVGTVHAADAGYCLRVVRTLEGIPASAPTAAAAWHAVPYAKQHGWYNAPVGVPVFWTGGSGGAGHVAISDGKGNVWTTDMLPSGAYKAGAYSLVPVGYIAKRWGLTYAGWGESLNGVTVYTQPESSAPAASTPAPPVQAPTVEAAPAAPVAEAPAVPTSFTPNGCGAAGCKWHVPSTDGS